MKKEELEIYNYIIIAIAVALVGAVFFWRFQNRDVYFARSVLYGLAKGNLGVARQIDWPNFKALGEDVGRIYNKMPNEQEKKDFQAGFVRNFSRGFQASQAKLNAYANWRVDSRETGAVVVAVDDTVHQKTALLLITKIPQHKLAGLSWKE